MFLTFGSAISQLSVIRKVPIIPRHHLMTQAADEAMTGGSEVTSWSPVSPHAVRLRLLPPCEQLCGEAIISGTSPPLCSQLVLHSLISPTSAPLYLLVVSLPSSYHKPGVSLASSLPPPLLICLMCV